MGHGKLYREGELSFSLQRVSRNAQRLARLANERLTEAEKG